MPIFEYQVLKTPGERLNGRLEAENRRAAIDILAGRGFHMLSLDEAEKPRLGFRRKMGLREVAQFSRNLGRMIRGGVPLGKAIAVLEQQADSRAGQETLRALRAAVQEGETFSNALGTHGRTFGPWYVSMIRAGETGGALSDSLERVGELLYREHDLRGRVRAALAYPGLMVTVGCATVFILLSFVIPKISVLFTDAGRSLPLPSLLLIRISEFFSAFWWAVLLGLVATGLLARIFYRSDAGRRWGDQTLLRTPLIGALILRSETARICRVLGTLLRHGVPLLQGLAVTSETLRNRVLQQAIEQIILQIRQGDPLSSQLEASGLFPAIMTHVVAVGEQSGELDRSLLELAEDYESEIDRSVQAIVSMIEPLLIILVGGVVGFIVMALLLPIFEINEVIQ